MVRGRVVGMVWATKKSPGLQGRKMLLVAVRQSGLCADGGEIIVALDTVQAGVGDDVMVSFGSGARAAFLKPPNEHILADAAVTMVIDGADPDLA